MPICEIIAWEYWRKTIALYELKSNSIGGMGQGSMSAIVSLDNIPGTVVASPCRKHIPDTVSYLLNTYYCIHRLNNFQPYQRTCPYDKQWWMQELMATKDAQNNPRFWPIPRYITYTTHSRNPGTLRKKWD